MHASMHSCIHPCVLVHCLISRHFLNVSSFDVRLRQLLAEEEQQYIVEMANKEETVLERQAKMRERAKQLKEKRESERLAFVEEKLEQQWRYDSPNFALQPSSTIAYY